MLQRTWLQPFENKELKSQQGFRLDSKHIDLIFMFETFLQSTHSGVVVANCIQLPHSVWRQCCISQSTQHGVMLGRPWDYLIKKTKNQLWYFPSLSLSADSLHCNSGDSCFRSTFLDCRHRCYRWWSQQTWLIRGPNDTVFCHGFVVEVCTRTLCANI